MVNDHSIVEIGLCLINRWVKKLSMLDLVALRSRQVIEIIPLNYHCCIFFFFCLITKKNYNNVFIESGSDLNEYVTTKVIDEIFNFIENKVLNPNSSSVDWEYNGDNGDYDDDIEIITQDA